MHVGRQAEELFSRSLSYKSVWTRQVLSLIVLLSSAAPCVSLSFFVVFDFLCYFTLCICDEDCTETTTSRVWGAAPISKKKKLRKICISLCSALREF